LSDFIIKTEKHGTVTRGENEVNRNEAHFYVLLSGLWEVYLCVDNKPINSINHAEELGLLEKKALNMQRSSLKGRNYF
jgi:hypothetical protein